MRFVHSSNAQIDGEMRWKYISVLGWKVCWPLIGCKQQQIDCSRRIKATECQLFGPNDTVYDFIIYLRDWFWHLLSCPWTLPFVRFVMVVGWRDFLFLLHRSDNFHRLRTLNHCTTALSVYLGSPVSAIFFEYRAHRWGYYLRKKMWQHNFTGRAHIHLYDDDDDTIFLVTIAAWWRVCAGGGVLLSLCCFALSDDWCRCGCFELHCLSSRRPPGE